MITTGLLKMALGLISGMTSGLGSLSFTVSDGFYEVLNNYLCCALYFIPFKQLMPIVIFVFTMFCFRAVVAVIETIWDLLPIL